MLSSAFSIQDGASGLMIVVGRRALFAPCTSVASDVSRWTPHRGFSSHGACSSSVARRAIQPASRRRRRWHSSSRRADARAVAPTTGSQSSDSSYSRVTRERPVEARAQLYGYATVQWLTRQGLSESAAGYIDAVASDGLVASTNTAIGDHDSFSPLLVRAVRGAGHHATPLRLLAPAETKTSAMLRDGSRQLSRCRLPVACTARLQYVESGRVM